MVWGFEESTVRGDIKTERKVEMLKFWCVSRTFSKTEGKKPRHAYKEWSKNKEIVLISQGVLKI